jgi:hypothetical protein
MRFVDSEDWDSESGDDLDAAHGLSRKVSLTLGGFPPSSAESHSDSLRPLSSLLRF